MDFKNWWEEESTYNASYASPELRSAAEEAWNAAWNEALMKAAAMLRMDYRQQRTEAHELEDLLIKPKE